MAGIGIKKSNSCTNLGTTSDVFQTGSQEEDCPLNSKYVLSSIDEENKKDDSS